MAVMVEAPVVQTSSTMTTERALFEEALDAAAGAVGLLGFADEEAVDEGRSVDFLRVPGAGRGDVRDDGVGAHGESADGRGLELVMVDEVEDGESGEASALGVEGGGAAVDVVIAGGSGGELEFAELEGGSGEEGEEGLAVAGGHGC